MERGFGVRFLDFRKWKSFMFKKSTLALGLLITAILVSPMASADDDQRRITVRGQGEVKAVPDIAVMSIGVETEAKAPSDALSENASRMTAVMAKLKDAGITEKDMQTSQLGIWQVYTDRSQSNTPPKISGYRASNQLRVTLRDIERIGEILDQTVADGASREAGPRAPRGDRYVGVGGGANHGRGFGGGPRKGNGPRLDPVDRRVGRVQGARQIVEPDRAAGCFEGFVLGGAQRRHGQHCRGVAGKGGG